jgi:2-(1,2-epoxy-1,2-dihydrophenyl)acetyl-CoA isomerase
MTDGIGYDVADEIATITLDRPEALNSLTTAMKVALIDALRSASNDGQVRAVVLTGAGRAFCVGQDLREHAEDLANGDEQLSTVTEHLDAETGHRGGQRDGGGGGGVARVRLRLADRV